MGVINTTGSTRPFKLALKIRQRSKKNNKTPLQNIQSVPIYNSSTLFYIMKLIYE